MAELERIVDFPAVPRVPIRPELRRIRNPGCPPVLMIHGASAQHQTFMIPEPDATGGRSLAAWLWEQGYEPWLLDWRGSMRVVETTYADPSCRRATEHFDLDETGKCEIPAALEWIRDVREREGDPAEELAALAHCLGAGALAHAIASGATESLGLTHVVLLTLALFYEPSIDGRFRSAGHPLERIWDQRRDVHPMIDPGRPESWPRDFADMYRHWPPFVKPHLAAAPSSIQELCNRLSFMYGVPYLEHNLVPEIHVACTRVEFVRGARSISPGQTIHTRSGCGTVHAARVDGGTWLAGNAHGSLLLTRCQGELQPADLLYDSRNQLAAECRSATAHTPQLGAQFGAIPLKLYLHAARNLRRGWAAPFSAANTDTSLVDRHARARFSSLERITLITGARNQLWNRASIDKMYDWLARGTYRDIQRVRKHVLRDYGHQDLLWGPRARHDVFERIAEGLPESRSNCLRATSRSRVDPARKPEEVAV